MLCAARMLRGAAARCTAVWRAAAAAAERRSATSFSDAAASAAAQYVPDRTSFTRRRAVLFALGAPLTALPVLAAVDDGVARSVYFNFYALPALAHYRLVEWLYKNAPEEELDKALLPLHERYAPISLAVILRLKGFYVKVRPAAARALCARAATDAPACTAGADGRHSQRLCAQGVH